uniref:EGF-like domain-containing protein n=1 Tax=Rhabditophanes sp. KR3021 TaxID=114890 RepID=A0AC35TFJ9_9BILA
MFKLLVAILLLASTASAADSDGKNFVFSYGYFTIPTRNVSLSSSAQANIYILATTSSEAQCNLRYQLNGRKTPMVSQFYAVPGRESIVNLPANNLIKTLSPTASYVSGQLNQDQRIFVDCTEPVKVFAEFFDQESVGGDMWLVPSKQIAGTDYIFSIPPSIDFQASMITIVPTVETATNILVSAHIYFNGEVKHSQVYSVNGSIGSKALNLLTYSQNEIGNYTIALTSSSPILVNLIAPFSTKGNDAKNCVGCKESYVSYMPIPSKNEVCPRKGVAGDKRIISADFTMDIFFSSPLLTSTCTKEAIVSLVTENFKDGTTAITVNKDVQTSFAMNSHYVATSSVNGKIPTYRFGGAKADRFNPSTTLSGKIAHYVPSMDEWVTGTTEFFTFMFHCVLEVYAEDTGSTFDLSMDGGVINPRLFLKSEKIKFFGKPFVRYEISVSGERQHTFEAKRKYVAYVVCPKIEPSNVAYGYLTGFNYKV